MTISCFLKSLPGTEWHTGMANRTMKQRKESRHELEIIDRLGFSAYFLITWDIVRYSMARGFIMSVVEAALIQLLLIV
jgi:DNA polymerase III alpha subunit